MPTDPWLIWIAKLDEAGEDGRRDVEVPADFGGLDEDALLIVQSRWTRAFDVREVEIAAEPGRVRFGGLRVLPHDDAEDFERRASAILEDVALAVSRGLTLGDEIARGLI
ncbi:hypothetical protein [Patulibacter sp. SYSU D01012]|uniref:hypothetical protein n=1 Tax=Patulibacter sp. SYSU D01012 TaxID=2817381 RepID=UPI001B30CA21|nr:hypothetical protein [Patulibacter sp. SYSU D01012]